MSVVVFFVLAIITFIYLAVPLMQERFWPFIDSSPVAELQREKREGLWAISDVDAELEMGKITPEDHGALRGVLKSELLEVMSREKALLGEVDAQGIEGMPASLKGKLLYEVLRICGLKKQ